MSYNYSTVTSQEKIDIINNQIKSFEIQHYRNSLTLIELSSVPPNKDSLDFDNISKENIDIEKKISVLKIELSTISNLLPKI